MASGIHFAMGGAIFGQLTREAIDLTARKGFPGLEPYRGSSMAWVEKPQELKALLDDKGIRLITASNGGPNQSTEFVDPAARQQTIDDHLAFCRDFLSVFGCTWFKINMGRRPASGTTPEQVKRIGETVEALGR